MPVVRISKGKFDPRDVKVAEQLLVKSETTLREPLSRLHGLLHYYVGIDRATGHLTNVSIWESPEDALRWTPWRRCLHSARYSRRLALRSRQSRITKRSGLVRQYFDRGANHVGDTRPTQ